MSGQNGKGDKRRPGKPGAYEDGWDRIFGKKTEGRSDSNIQRLHDMFKDPTGRVLIESYSDSKPWSPGVGCCKCGCIVGANHIVVGALGSLTKVYCGDGCRALDP